MPGKQFLEGQLVHSSKWKCDNTAKVSDLQVPPKELKRDKMSPA